MHCLAMDDILFLKTFETFSQMQRSGSSLREEVSMFMQSYAAHMYALLRLVTGLLFLWHGTQKLFGFPLPMPFEAPVFIVNVAGPIELIGGALVMAGLFTRWAAFLCSGLMAAAYWMAHRMKAFFPIENGGELAVLYCFTFLYISAHGPGIWSVDDVRKED